jgi:SIR2-like domain
VPRAAPYADRLLGKVRAQLKSRRVGFLLGAGSSYLDGQGYPLASGLWPLIKESLQPSDVRLIEDRLKGDPERFEAALDEIDIASGATDFPLRGRVAQAIADRFRDLNPPLTDHQRFARGIARRQERRIPVFSLNYDCLMEGAADEAKCRISDGFQGVANAYFDISCLRDNHSLPGVRRGRACALPVKGTISLIKLHGSVSWFADNANTPRRTCPSCDVPDDWNRLMIPPQHRKASDSATPPYAQLWSEFRAHLANDERALLNRLFVVGYGMGDGHVNAVIQAALARRDFTLVVLARSLKDSVFESLASGARTIVITESRSALYGESGEGFHEEWGFNWLASEVHK